MFTESDIPGVFIADLKRFNDERGWLTELWRTDWCEPFDGPVPVMSYISMTSPGVARGPHEHRHQTDYFAFIGPGDLELHLWDDRADSPARGRHLFFTFGEARAAAVTIPPGVVHGYRCVSDVPGMVINFADRLYAGRNKQAPVDEIRHEDQDGSPFRMTPDSTT